MYSLIYLFPLSKGVPHLGTMDPTVPFRVLTLTAVTVT